MSGIQDYRTNIRNMLQGTLGESASVELLREQNTRGVTPEEVFATIEEIERLYQRKAPMLRQAINIVGTGRAPGRKVPQGGRFTGISSATALVLAGMGMRVVKHGGRGKDDTGSEVFFEHLAQQANDQRMLNEGNPIFAFVGVRLPESLRNIRSQIAEGTVFNSALPFATPFMEHESMRFIGVSGDSAHFDLMWEVAIQYLARTQSEMMITLYQGRGAQGAECIGEVSPADPTFFCTVTRHGPGLLRIFLPESCGQKAINPKMFAGDYALTGKEFMRMMTSDASSWSERDHAMAHMVALNAAFVRLRYVEYREHTPAQLSYASAQYENALLAMQNGRVKRLLFQEE